MRPLPKEANAYLRLVELAYERASFSTRAARGRRGGDTSWSVPPMITIKKAQIGESPAGAERQPGRAGSTNLHLSRRYFEAAGLAQKKPGHPFG